MKKLKTTILAVIWLMTFAVFLADAQVVSVSIDELVTGQAELPVRGDVSTGQPNTDALKIAADSGYKAVIDLRGEDEERGIDEKAEVEALSMSYLSLPITDRSAINYDNAAELDRMLAQFDGPVLMHCGSGNRVGALIALRARLNGANVEEALEAGRAAGLTSLEPVVLERFAGDPR